MNARSAVISEGLAPYVREEDLAKNAANYPEMQQELTQEAQERVARIAEHLLTVPLFHAYHDPNAIGSIREHGLLSHSATPSEGGMTHRLDKSLELDKYSFWTWGQLLDDRFGGNVIAVDAATVLLGNTIVTPRDIASSVTRENQHRDYQVFDDAAKERVTETYFQKIVHGMDWLQIVARRVDSSHKHWPYFPLSTHITLGEIKSKDPVPGGAILGDPIDIGSFDNGHIGRFKIAQQIAQKGLVLGHIVSDAYGDPDSIGASNVKYAQEQVRAARSCWESVLGVSFGSEGNFGIL